MLDHLKAVLHNFLDKTLATELHSEIVDLSNRVSILELEILGVKNPPAAAPGPSTPASIPTVIAAQQADALEEVRTMASAGEPLVDVSAHTEPIAQPEPEHGQEVQETEAHS